MKSPYRKFREWREGWNKWRARRWYDHRREIIQFAFIKLRDAGWLTLNAESEYFCEAMKFILTETRRKFNMPDFMPE